MLGLHQDKEPILLSYNFKTSLVLFSKAIPFFLRLASSDQPRLQKIGYEEGKKRIKGVSF